MLNILSISRDSTHKAYDEVTDLATTCFLFLSLILGVLLFGVLIKPWSLPAHHIVSLETDDFDHGEHFEALKRFHGDMEGIATEMELKLYAKAYRRYKKKQTVDALEAAREELASKTDEVNFHRQSPGKKGDFKEATGSNPSL